jgi:hypothetical protein
MLGVRSLLLNKLLIFTSSPANFSFSLQKCSNTQGVGTSFISCTRFLVLKIIKNLKKNWGE